VKQIRESEPMTIPAELSPEDLRCPCSPELFDFESTADLDPLREIIGQDRATQAIAFGTAIQSSGYNIFALGPTGAGRATAIRQFLEAKAASEPAPEDWCYVYSFGDPSRPRSISLPPGRGCVFKRDMSTLVEELRADMSRAFEGAHYEERRKEILQSLQERQSAAFAELEKYLNERSFTLIRTPAGLAIAPVMEGKPLSAEEYTALDAETREQFEAHRSDLDEQMSKTMREVREQEKQIRAEVERLDHELAEFVVSGHLQELREKYKDCPTVIEHLKDVEEDVVQHASLFLGSGEQPEPAAIALPIPLPRASNHLDRYEVNLLVDRCDATGAPVIVETNPTYHNLVGRVEHRVELGAMLTHFTMIKAGALHRANGGYLVVDAKRVLTNPLAWDALKRALSNKEAKIEEMGEAYRAVATAMLQPEPIPLRVKVVLIGDPEVYYLLHNLDEDFRELFKVKADFETRMSRTEESVRSYALFIGERCRQEGLYHFDPSAVARVVEYGSRLVEDQQKLSTRFANIADLVRESAYWATQSNRSLVTGTDVQRALDERTRRSNRIEEQILEATERGFLFVDTSGEVVGQVNGLSVLSMGDYEFGKPSRITARTFSGKAGVVNIDREVKMTGPIHDKGVLILTGYLGGKYAQKQSLTLSASVVFEQAYEGVEGDSASSTELYALLSSLAGVPIRQGIAVTGSVNQRGEIQPVGGVTQKIEGFFGVCKAKGFTGEQGVIIPSANTKSLMLRDEVIDAVRDGKFHVYPVATVDEGISILTNREAGEPGEGGVYPEGTINALVTERLSQLAEEAKKKDQDQEEKDESSASERE
jgi:lon-related putative ATP-dependent protease